MNINIDQTALRRIKQEHGDKIRTIVNDTARETADHDLEAAIDTLHQRLNAVGGNFPRDWSKTAIETLRRGEDFEIRIQ